MRVAIVSASGGGSRRYRCDHRAEMLELGGARVEVYPDSYRRTILDRGLLDYDCVILHRAPGSRQLERFVQEARVAGTAVLYDTDDLVFEPDLAARISWTAKFPEEVGRGKLASRRRAMAACTGVTVSTEPLRRAASAVNPHVIVLPNVVDTAMVAAASPDAWPRREPAEGVVIGYFSGTASHDDDFREATAAVGDVLEACPTARLLVVGPLTLDPVLARFGPRIERIERRPFTELPRLIGLVDLALAPIERGNPFAEAKSGIKYLEAGLVGVPVLASATSDFARVIRDRETGLLATTHEEWHTRLLELVHDSALRASLGRAAWDDVRACHTTSARAGTDNAALAGLLSATRARLTPGLLLARARWRLRKAR